MIQEIEIHDVYGIRDLVIKLGAVTILKGKNGRGKSSVIKALMSVFEGGHDPGMLRRAPAGEPQPERGSVFLKLEDQTTIHKIVKLTGSTVDVLDPMGRVVAAPQTHIRQLADATACDPCRLLTAKPKDIIDVFLQVSPVQFTAAELDECVHKDLREYAKGSTKSGDYPALLKWRAGGQLNLEELWEIREQLNASRKAQAKVEDESVKTVRQLRASLPEDDKTDWAREALFEAKRLEEAIAAKTKAIAANTAYLTGKEAAIRQEAQRKIDAIIRDRDLSLSAERKAHDEERARIDSDHDPIIAGYRESATSAAEKEKEQSRAAGARETIEKFEKAAGKSGLLNTKLQIVLESIDALRLRKLEALPIPGIEIREKMLFYDGVPWPHVNTAKRVEIVFMLWDLQGAPFAISDSEAEHFDPETWEAFLQFARTSGRQVLMGRVTDDAELTIETLEQLT